jgi:large repetitive protein
MRHGLLRFRVAAAAAAALVGVLSAAAIFSGGPPGVSAAPAALAGTFSACGNTNQQAIASGNTFECDYFTTASIPITTGSNHGFQLKLTAPAGTTFDGTQTLGFAPGCTIVTSNATTLNFKCTGGAAPGSEFAVLLDAGGTAGQVAMTAKYGKPSNITATDNATFNYQFDATGGDGQAAVHANSNLNFGNLAVTCANTNPAKTSNAPIAVGDTFSCQVAFGNLVTPGHAVLTPDAIPNIGGFTLSNAGQDNTGLPSGVTGYSCPPGFASNCIGYTFQGTANSPGQIEFDQDFYALGAAKPHSEKDVKTGIFIIASTSTTVTATPNPVVVNNATTLKATVTPGSGCTLNPGADQVQFIVDGVNVGGPVSIDGAGVASVNYTPSTTGSKSVVAHYLGNLNCGDSSGTATLVVIKAATTSTILITDTHGNAIPGNHVPAGTTIEVQAFVTPQNGCTFTTADGNQVVILDQNQQPVLGLTVVQTAIANLGQLGIIYSFTTSTTGPYGFETAFQGTANCAASFSALTTINAQSTAPNLTLTTSPASPNYVGQPIVLTATLGSLNNCTLDTGVNGDTIQFFDGATIIGAPQVINSNIFTYQITFTPNAAGPHTFTAQYVPGANNFDCRGSTAATNPAVTNVTQGTTTTKLSRTIGNPTVAPGTTVQFEAVVTAGAGCTLTFNTDSVTFTIMQGANTVLTQIVPITGAGSTGDAFLNYTFANAGTYQVSVAYDNSANCSTSSDGPLTQIVAGVPTTLALSSSSNPVNVNHPVTFTATMTPAFPGCTFLGATDPAPVFTYDNSLLSGVSAFPTIPPGGATETWTVTYSPPASGAHTVKAVWAGNATCGGSSATLTQNVTIGVATVAVTTTPNASTGNQSVTLKATVTPDLPISGCVLNDGGVPQTITFTFNGLPAGTAPLTPGTSSDASAETATVSYTPLSATSAAGVTVTASYPGDASCAPATGSTNQVVNLASDSIQLTGPATTPVNAPVTYLASVQAGPFCALNSTDVVDLIVNGVQVATAQLSAGTYAPNTSSSAIPLTFTPTTVGIFSVHAHYEGNSLCIAQDSTTMTTSFTVTANAPTVTVSSSANPSAGPTPIVFTATITPLNGCLPSATDTVQFSYNGTNIGSPVLISQVNATTWHAVSASYTPSAPTGIAGVPVTATYTPSAGSPTCATATNSPALMQVVNAGNTSITLVANPTNPTAGSSDVITATVAPTSVGNGCTPTTADQVKFTVDAGAPQFFNLNGSNQASITLTNLTQTTHTITADYVTTNVFCIPPSTGTLSLVVGAAAAVQPTLVLTSSPASPVNSGNNLEFVATVGAVGGCTPTNADTVSFSYASTSGPITIGPFNLVNGVVTSPKTGAGNTLAGGLQTIDMTYHSNTAGCADTTGTGQIQNNNTSGNAATGVNFNYTVAVQVTNQKVATIADPSCTAGVTYTYTINWGDGHTDSVGPVTAASLGGCNNLAITGTHTYAVGGTHTVTTTITASDLLSSTATGTATPVGNNNNNSNTSGGGYVPPAPYNGNGYQPNPYPNGPAKEF